MQWFLQDHFLNTNRMACCTSHTLPILRVLPSHYLLKLPLSEAAEQLLLIFGLYCIHLPKLVFSLFHQLAIRKWGVSWGRDAGTTVVVDMKDKATYLYNLLCLPALLVLHLNFSTSVLQWIAVSLVILWLSGFVITQLTIHGSRGTVTWYPIVRHLVSTKSQ